MSITLNKSRKDINLINYIGNENSIVDKIDILDYATLKKLHSFQPSLQLHEDKYSNDAILISELKKIYDEPKKLRLKEKSSKEIIYQTKMSSKNLDKLDFNKRNNQTVMRCLKQYKNFISYMKFNNISIDLLEKICPLLMHRYIPKGNYLFKEKQKPHIFFGVINGEISLRTYNPDIILENKRKYENEELNMEKIYIFRKNKKLINNSNENQNNTNNDNNELINEKLEINKIDMEEKRKKSNLEINYSNIPDINHLIKEGYNLKILKKGDCYGIYNLLNSQEYEISGVTLENTNIFYIEKDHFDKYLLGQISRIDLERKYLINKIIPAIPMELLNIIKPEIYENNHIIYTEFDYAFDAIFIYKGSAELKKYDSAKSKNDIYEHKNILKTITKIEEGGIAGLEICKGPNSFYDNTLMITDSKTIIYRINIFNLNGKRHLAKSNIKKFFSKLYEQQKKFLKKAEEKNKEYKDFYRINTKEEKPIFNYSNYFNKIFKDVNPPNKTKRNKILQHQFHNLISNNSNKKNNSSYHNKTLFNSRYKTVDIQKKNIINCFSIKKNKEGKKYTIDSKKICKNEEEKNIPINNSLNIYNSLSSYTKIKNQKEKSTNTQNSKFNLFLDYNRNNRIKTYIFAKEVEKSEDSSFPKLFKDSSTNTNKRIFSYKIGNSKNKRINSVDKCLYDSGDFQIPFVTLTDNNIKIKNIAKMKNLAHYAKLKKIILKQQLLC